MLQELYKEQTVLWNLLNTAVLVGSVIVGRILLVRSIKRLKIEKSESRRNWIVQINNVASLIVALGLIIIWAAKLQTFALSLVALAAAIAISTKELIMCFLGGIYKSMNRSFRIGDRIEIAGSRGEVVDHNFFETELLEIGPGSKVHQYTGRVIKLPNSIFLANPLFRESWLDKFRLHTFSVIEPLETDISKHRELLLELSTQCCKEYLEEAKRFMLQVQHQEGIEAPSVDPRVSIVLQCHNQVEYIVRIPVPSMRAARVEQEILNQYVLRRTPPAISHYGRSDS